MKKNRQIGLANCQLYDQSESIKIKVRWMSACMSATPSKTSLGPNSAGMKSAFVLYEQLIDEEMTIIMRGNRKLNTSTVSRIESLSGCLTEAFFSLIG